MKGQSAALTLAVLGTALFAVPGAASAAQAMKVPDAIWANGELFGTVLTPTSFKAPPSHSLDLLYNFEMSGLRGHRSVAESAPGDPTYDGGRWWVQKVAFTEMGRSTFDPDGDGVVNFELKSAADVLHYVSLGDLEIFATDVFFECPLLNPSGH
jgi:hypothetical protein